MEEKLRIIAEVLGPGRVKFNEPLSNHVFSKKGGCAEAFYIATSKVELLEVLQTAMQLNIPVSVFGSGTKIMIPGDGIQGLVVKNRTNSIKISSIKGKAGLQGIGIEEALVEADSGVSVGKLNDFLKRQSLKQVLGIGSVRSSIGGAIFFDPILQSVTYKIKVWDKGDTITINKESLLGGDYVVLSLILKIKAKFTGK